jgi:MFS family permease
MLRRAVLTARLCFYSVWEATSGFAQIIGAVLMYLIGQSTTLSIASWRVMFLVCGSFTVVAGAIFIWLMPTDTTTAWFLTEYERRIATERLAMDRGTRDKTQFDSKQVKEGIFDPQTWLLFLIALFICIPSPILKVCYFIKCVHHLLYLIAYGYRSSRLWLSTASVSVPLRPCW